VIPCEEDKAGHHPVTPALAFFPHLEHLFHGERSTQEIMINVIIHHEVADYMAWKAAFDSSLDWRHKNGERGCRIFRSAGNVNDLTFSSNGKVWSRRAPSSRPRTQNQNGGRWSQGRASGRLPD